MAKTFYLKLATGNLRRNRRMYGPYCVASALMSGICFIILNLVLNQSIGNLDYGATVQAMFLVGIVVMSLFMVGYMLYINSFLIKRRKKEFGLYAVLGMERRHVARVILWENTLLTGLSLLLGIAGGAIFGRLVFMLLMQLLDTAKGSVFTLSGIALLITLLLFGGIFVLTTLYNLLQVRLANPIDLLKGQQKGEKPMRSAWLVTVLGLLLLGLAYYLAISTQNPSLALMWFWPAVILVIIATWLLFTGGSVFILRRLKARRGVYYKPQNFITISGLIYRMKQNAAGLANICILSTMVMVTVSCCCALFFGSDAIVRRQNPSDISLSVRAEDPTVQARLTQALREEAAVLADVHGVRIERMLDFESARFFVGVDADFYHFAPATDGTQAPAVYAYTLLALTLADYSRLTGDTRTLAPDELLLLREGGPELLAIGRGENRFTVAQQLAGTPFTDCKNSKQTDSFLYAVLADQDAVDRLAMAVSAGSTGANMRQSMRLDVDGDEESAAAYAQDLYAAFTDMIAAQRQQVPEVSVTYEFGDIWSNREDGYALYGGLLFLGVFFSLLFLTNTVLILYFKQISEGYDDAERFAILQKVGLSDEEVRRTINRQMLIVFLAPLVASLVHMLAATNMIRQMLVNFLLTDFVLTQLCIAVTALVFVAVYLVMYRLTAKVYYRLVRW